MCCALRVVLGCWLLVVGLFVVVRCVLCVVCGLLFDVCWSLVVVRCLWCVARCMLLFVSCDCSMFVVTC